MKPVPVLIALLVAAFAPGRAGAEQQTVSRDFLCYNHVVFHTPDWEDRRYASAVRALGAGRLRIPGGTLADFWDWGPGGIVGEDRWPSGVRPPYSYEARSLKGMTLPAIAPFFAATGSKPMFGLNVFSVDLASELQALKEAAVAGLVVDRIQIGNEPYFAEPYMTERFPQPEDFAAFAVEAAADVRSAFPEAQIAVPGVVMTRDREAKPRLAGWNEALIAAGVFDVADAVFIHPYIGSNLRAIDADPGALTPAHAAQVARWGLQPDNFFLGQDWLARLPAATRIWITEYNYFEPAGGERVSGTWLQGLVNAARVLRWMDDPRIEHACLHQLIGHHAWQALASAKGGALTYRDGRPEHADDAEPFALAASGVALARLGKVVGEGEARLAASSLDAPGAPVVARVFRHRDGAETAILINLSDSPVDASALLPNAATAEIVSGEPWSAVYDPAHTTVSQQTVFGRALAAPPFSIVTATTRP
ncbi:MAG: hypothetical protein AAGL49_04010 [Pseudomonadota bacterium]